MKNFICFVIGILVGVLGYIGGIRVYTNYQELQELANQITVDDIEQAGVNSGKKLEAMPLYLIAFLSDTVYVPLDVIPVKKIKDGGKIIFSYETYLPKEINRVQVGYKPFVGDWDNQWMESSSVTMTENKEVDFSIECEL